MAGIHELTSSDGLNPLVTDDRALAADALPLEVIELALSCDCFCTAWISQVAHFSIDFRLSNVLPLGVSASFSSLPSNLICL